MYFLAFFFFFCIVMNSGILIGLMCPLESFFLMLKLSGPVETHQVGSWVCYNSGRLWSFPCFSGWQSFLLTPNSWGKETPFSCSFQLLASCSIFLLLVSTRKVINELILFSIYFLPLLFLIFGTCVQAPFLVLYLSPRTPLWSSLSVLLGNHQSLSSNSPLSKNCSVSEIHYLVAFCG